METNLHILTLKIFSVYKYNINVSSISVFLFHGGIRTLALRIFNNLVSYSAQRLLGENNNKLSQVFSRISSGQRILKIADDSAGLMTSEALRSDARTLRQGVRNLNEGLSLLNVVDGAISEQASILIRMRELSQQSATGTIGETERQSTNLEFDAMRTELNRISKTTEFNGIKLLDGTLASSASNHMSLQFGLDSKDDSNININTAVNVTSLTSLSLNLTALSIATQDGAVAANNELQVTMDNLTKIRGRLGSTQNRLEKTLNHALTSAENLTAAGSTISDADMASEFAHLTKQQILVQSSSSMIGQANLFPQGVIQLLP
jgi:flagellin